MAKAVKISPIRHDYSGSSIETMSSSLAKKNLTRTPGTGVYFFPFREMNGKYRTGLDEKASYIQRIEDPNEREVEIEKVKQWRQEIAEGLGVEESYLSPTSEFWNYSKSKGEGDPLHVSPIKLMDTDNIFDLNDLRKKIAFCWLRVHPQIAPSMEAYNMGRCSPTVQFHVSDSDVESAVKYKKNQLVNKAIATLNAMTPTRQRQVARLMGLPVSDNTKEEMVYNMIDENIKSSAMKGGEHKGVNPINLFNRFANMKEDILRISDLVEQALRHSIYRLQDGEKVYEGSLKLSSSKEEWVRHLLDEDNQEDLIALEDKLKAKKLVAI